MRYPKCTHHDTHIMIDVTSTHLIVFKTEVISRFCFCSPCALNHFCIAKFSRDLFTHHNYLIKNEYFRMAKTNCPVTEKSDSRNITNAVRIERYFFHRQLWSVFPLGCPAFISVVLTCLWFLLSFWSSVQTMTTGCYWLIQLKIIRTKLRRPTQMPKITNAHAPSFCGDKKSSLLSLR